MKQHEPEVARSCLMARGNRADFLPRTAENSGFKGLCLGWLSGVWGLASDQDETCSDTKYDIPPKG